MSYKTTIEIGVVGVGQIGLLQKSLNQVATTVDTLNKKQVNAGFNVQNLNTYNNLLQKAWQNINKAAMGSQEELQAVRNLVKAKNNQIAAQTRLNTLIAKEELAQKRIVATANAGFGVQGPALPPTTKPKGPKQGSLGFNPAASAENIALGAGFPLLFGGGAGQVAGGFAGSFFGGGFGGQILGSAIGQILEDAQRRITEIGNAVRQLNMDNLRSSVVYVNAELDTTVRRLVEAGKSQQALAVAAEAVTQQTGLVPKAVDNITTNVTVLGNTWNQFVSAISGTLALLGAPFVQVITMILSGWTKIFQYANLIGSSIRAWGLALLEGVLKKYPILQFLLNNVLNGVSLVTEEEQRRAAALQAVIDKQSTEIANNAKNLGIEKQRTLGRTAAEKQINIDVERRLELNKIETEYDARKKQYLTDHVGLEQAKLNEGLLQIEQLRQQAVDQANIKLLLQEQALEIEANTERYKQATEAINRQIEALERTNAVKQSAFQAEAALNDLYGVQLERLYQLASTAKERYNIALAQFQQQIKAADIEYKQALAANELLLDKARLQNTLIGLKYKEIDAEKSIAIAQAAARGNTVTQIRKISDAYDNSLAVQREVISAANDQLAATEAIASNQDTVAKAVYQTKILQAESALAQKLMSDELGFSKDQAFNLAGHMASVAMSAIAAVGPSGEIAAAAQSAAFNYRNLLTTTTQTADKQRNVAASTANVASATAQAAANTGEMARNMQTTAKAANDAFAGLSKFGGVSLSRSGLEPWMQREISQKVAAFADMNRSGSSIDQYLARVAYEAKLIEEYRTKLGTVIQAETRASDIKARTEFNQRYMQAMKAPAFATGGFINRPTLGLIGEGGESEYIVPESKAAGFATNYLFGERGAGAIPSSAESNSGVSIGAPVINITTGPVVEFNGERYVTVADMERAMRATANGVIGRLRTPSARIALGMA